MSHKAALLFVYNADSGLFNTLADIGHKIFSPATYGCALCTLTHGYFQERRQWRAFVDGLGCDCEFLHRDQFIERYPRDQTALPAVFLQRNGGLECCIDATTLEGCNNLEALQALVMRRCCHAAG